MDGNAPSQPVVHTGIGFNLSVIVLALAALALGLAYLIDSTRHATRAPAQGVARAATVTRTLSGRDLEIPTGWFRFGPGTSEGFAKQIELRLTLPLGADEAPVPIDVTLLPRSRVRPSSSLLDGVYLHQFKNEQLGGGPVGLVGKPLVAAEGYEGETVWYDPLSAQPFAAKCNRSIASSPTQHCLRTVYLAPGLAAIYGFPEEALASWRRFDAVINEQMKRIGAL